MNSIVHPSPCITYNFWDAASYFRQSFTLPLYLTTTLYSTISCSKNLISDLFTPFTSVSPETLDENGSRAHCTTHLPTRSANNLQFYLRLKFQHCHRHLLSHKEVHKLKGVNFLPDVGLCCILDTTAIHRLHLFKPKLQIYRRLILFPTTKTSMETPPKNHPFTPPRNWYPKCL